MANINVKDLTFCYDNSYINVFDKVSFQINTDWKLGLVARNGRGKTTLLKILSGILPYKGSISSNLSFQYFPYDLNEIVSSTKKNINECSTLDVVKIINTNVENWQIERELNLLGVDLDVLNRDYFTLSYGEQTKVMLATMFTKENNFLLIDEPTNHLDTLGRAKLSEYLKSKKSFILVSHDRFFIDNCIDHVIAINKSGIEIYACNLSTFLENKEAEERGEIIKNNKIKAEIERLNIAKKQTSDWSDKVESSKYGGKQASGLKVDRGHVGAQAAKMMKRSKAIEGRIEKQVEEKSTLLKDLERIDALNLKYLPFYKERLISVNNLCVMFGTKTIFDNISFEVERGDKIGIVGGNGSGKSSLIKVILGEIVPTSGICELASNLKIVYVSQTFGENKGSLNDFCIGLNGSDLRTMLIKLGFNKEMFDIAVNNFSDGQKKKLLIAKALCEPANLYVFDEPLNYLDIETRIQIENMLMQDVTMIFVEHDKKFLDKIANKLVFMK